MIAGRRQRFPLRTTAATYPDDGDPELPFVIVQNPTGGVFPGDRLRLAVEVATGARAHVRNQSATKVYAGDGETPVQEIVFRVGDGATLEYFGDMLIPHAGSEYCQLLHVDASATARFISVETLVAGRIAHGERFAFARARLATAATVDGDLVCHDVVDLVPERRYPGVAGCFADASYLTTMLVVSPADDAEALAHVLDQAVQAVAGRDAGASTLPSGAGVIVRALSRSAVDARRVIGAAWSSARMELSGRQAPRRFLP